MNSRYPGVRARNNSVQVDFTLNGRRARFSLDIPPTPLNLRYAADLRAAAKLDISKGIFDASKFFPDSKSRLVTSKRTQKISDALTTFLRDSERLLAPSTLRDYTSAINHHLVPYFGSTRLDELTIIDVKDWIADQSITAKRINNVLIPLRKVFSNAYYAGLIHSNPFDRIKSLPHTPNSLDPFTLNEMKRILLECSGLVRALFQFAFWTGLRTSELIALEWQDVDFKNKQIYVNRAEVRGRVKGTKTYSGTRTVQLNSLTLAALELARANAKKSMRRVFLNPRTMKPWTSDGQIRKTAWTPALDAAGARYRRPYQTRHTLLPKCLHWVQSQCGWHNRWGIEIGG